MGALTRGAIAGGLATVPMTLAMLYLHRRLPPEQQYDLPPREITEVIAHKAGVDQALQGSMREASLLAHFAYGAATGALFCLVAERRHHPLACGGAYGLAVWAASYLGWIPAAGILKPATRHPLRRTGMMLASHLLWGAALGFFSQRLARQKPAA